MNARLCFKPLASAVTGLVIVTACAVATAEDDGYNAFLQKIAADCKPLVIGNDNFGEAITFNGLGADSSNYSVFLTRTQALYNGGITPKTFHDSYALGESGGKFSDRAIECIIAHVPKR